MKRYISLLLFLQLFVVQYLYADEIVVDSVYIRKGTELPLTVPEAETYLFNWEIETPSGAKSTLDSTSHITEPYLFDEYGVFIATVQPIDIETSCEGEYLLKYIYVIDTLELFAQNDIFSCTRNSYLDGDVRLNDIPDQETGTDLVYSSTPVLDVQNGILELNADGTFHYTPTYNFTGVDSFYYSVQTMFDPDFPDNPIESDVAMVTIRVGTSSSQSDLEIVKVGPDEAQYYGSVKYTITITNNGPSSASNVMMTDIIPFGVYDVSFSYENQPWEDWLGSDTIPRLNANETVVYELEGKLNPAAPRVFYNQAEVSSEQIDPNTLNNTSIWRTEARRIVAVVDDTIRVPSCESVELDASDTEGAVSFEWEPSTYLSSATSSKPTFVPGETTQYVLKVTDADGYVDYDSVYVYVHPRPQVVIPDTVFFDRADGSVQLDASQSIGESLTYDWTTLWGVIRIGENDSIATVEEPATYNVRITDDFGCEIDKDVEVRYTSYPPVARTDTVYVIQGVSTDFNVLSNDYDVNDFSLGFRAVVTQPSLGDMLAYDDEGNITYCSTCTDYHRWDSIQYCVHNTGEPERETNCWIYIYIDRPPLNADLEIQKTAPYSSFFEHEILYDLTVTNLGPDTPSVVTIFDAIDPSLLEPTYTIDAGLTWHEWLDSLVYDTPLYPNDPLVVQIKATAGIEAQMPEEILNHSHVSHDDVFLDYIIVNDTSKALTYFRDPVFAIAGDDIYRGSCNTTATLDASLSSGTNITYLWTPSTGLSNARSSKPTFRGSETTTYILTVTDDLGSTNTDTITVHVLEPPVADAGPDREIELDKGYSVSLDGSGSFTDGETSYQWSTSNGRINGLTKVAVTTSKTPGTYHLTVTDSLGCTSQDEMKVSELILPPVAMDDYYSATPNEYITGNLLDNDFDINGQEIKLIDVGQFQNNGRNVSIIINWNSDGSFSLSGPNYAMVINATYTIENEDGAQSTADIVMTFASQTIKAEIEITKTAMEPVVTWGEDIIYQLDVTNNGPDAAEEVILRDDVNAFGSLDYLENIKYSKKGPTTGWLTWNGTYTKNDLAAGDSFSIWIKGTVKSESPSIYFNSAIVAGNRYDTKPENNSDTVRVIITHDVAIKMGDDFSVAQCDQSHKIPVDGSKGVAQWSWSPEKYVSDPTAQNPYFIPDEGDTTIMMYLTATGSSGIGVSDSIRIHVYPEAIAISDPLVVINPDTEIALDGSASTGDELSFQWYYSSTNTLISEDAITEPVSEFGNYRLEVEDKYGCIDEMNVELRRNRLYAINDFIVLLKNSDPHTGTMLLNDFDPDVNDSINIIVEIIDSPEHGTLTYNETDYHKSSTLDPRTIGTYVYTVDADYAGDDQFTYRVCDTNTPAYCQMATVYIKVITLDDENAEPVATPDYFMVTAGDTIAGNVMSNDFDYDGGTIIFSKFIDAPSVGSIVTNENDGSFTYYSDPDFIGVDVFTYEIVDNGRNVESAQGIVQIFCLESYENNRPSAVDDAYYCVELSISGNILDNDTDPEGNDFALALDSITEPEHGTLTIDKYGDFTYIPDEGFYGTDHFTYQIYDLVIGGGLYSTASVYIVSMDPKDYSTDLSIVKTAPAEILSNETIVFDLSVTVEGPTLAPHVYVKDILPDTLVNGEYFEPVNGTWEPWEDSIFNVQIPLFETYDVKIRAQLPKYYSGPLYNTGETYHLSNEPSTLLDNNTSTSETQVFQSIDANAGEYNDIVGFCPVEESIDGKRIVRYMLDGTHSCGPDELTYRWVPGDLFDDPTIATPTFIGESYKTYDIYLQVSAEYNGETYTDIDTATITFGEELTVQILDDYDDGFDGAIFLPPEVEDYTLRANITGVPETYDWWVVEPRSGDTVHVADTEFAYISDDISNLYHLDVTDIYGCLISSTMFVEFEGSPPVANDDGIREVIQQTPDTCAVYLNDTDADDDIINSSVEIVTPPAHGTARVMPDGSIMYVGDMFFYDNGGDMDGLDTLEYNIYDYSALESLIPGRVIYHVNKADLFIPEVFTPNGDGLNDFLVVKGLEFYESNLINVFNSWGALVFQEENYSNDEPWDGVANQGIRFGSGPLPAGTYYVHLKINDGYGTFLKQTIYISTGQIKQKTTREKDKNHIHTPLCIGGNQGFCTARSFVYSVYAECTHHKSSLCRITGCTFSFGNIPRSFGWYFWRW